jgi:uncharacterized small protein (DUF1192 family)
MPRSSKLRILASSAIAMIVVTLAAAPVRAQTTPDSDSGRYKFSPTPDGGVLRLDTRTGGVSNCAKRDTAGWACYSVPDERDALDAEIGRLQAETTRLKDELKKRDVAGAANKSDTPAPNGNLEKNNNPDPGKTDAGKGNRLELQLPSDQDIDRMVGYLERAWRRLVDAANRMQRDVQGKI